MKTLSITILISMTCLALSCGNKQGARPNTFFPEKRDAAGWSKAGETRAFAADNLWQYIDGDAEKYIQAGVVQTLTADYRFQDKIDAVADVYVMGTAEGAGKVFESEPPAGSQSVALGDAGRLYGASLIFRKGRYFVRLVAYHNDPEIGKALLDLAGAIEERLG